VTLFNRLFPRVSLVDLERLRDDLMDEAQLDSNFLVLTVSSCIIATLGLLVNSTAVIIGAMIIAPLMMPLRSLALGALDVDGALFRTSAVSLGIGTLIAVLVSGLVGGLFGVPASSLGTEILARTQPNLADLLVAIAAGAIGGFARLRPKINDAIAGTAIAVALMPPLCVVGITLSQGAWEMAGGAFLLYSTNFIGITLACIVVFTVGGYYADARRMRKAIFWFLLSTGILVVPLFLSLINFIRQERLEDAIRRSLVQETVTVGQHAELVDLKVQWNAFPWNSYPPRVVLRVRSDRDLTSNQVRLVEDFLEQRFGERFELIFRVSEFREVTSEEPAATTTPIAPPQPAKPPTPDLSPVP